MLKRNLSNILVVVAMMLICLSQDYSSGFNSVAAWIGILSLFVAVLALFTIYKKEYKRSK